MGGCIVPWGVGFWRGGKCSEFFVRESNCAIRGNAFNLRSGSHRSAAFATGAAEEETGCKRQHPSLRDSISAASKQFLVHSIYIYAIIFNSRESILIQMHDVMFFEIIAAASLCFGCGVHQVSRAQILPDFPNRPPNWPAERGRRIIIRPPGSPSQLRPNIRPAIRENCYLIQNKY